MVWKICQVLISRLCCSFIITFIHFLILWLIKTLGTSLIAVSPTLVVALWMDRAVNASLLLIAKEPPTLAITAPVLTTFSAAWGKTKSHIKNHICPWYVFLCPLIAPALDQALAQARSPLPAGISLTSLRSLLLGSLLKVITTAIQVIHKQKHAHVTIFSSQQFPTQSTNTFYFASALQLDSGCIAVHHARPRLVPLWLLWLRLRFTKCSLALVCINKSLVCGVCGCVHLCMRARMCICACVLVRACIFC